MKLSLFDNNDNMTMGVGFWSTKQFTIGISIQTVTIWDEPIQKVNNKSRIIDTAYLLLWMSKLLSFSKTYAWWFDQLRS